MAMTIFQEKRLAEEVADLEKDTGFKLRILAQNYPDTPGSHSLLSLYFYFLLQITILFRSIPFQNLFWHIFFRRLNLWSSDRIGNQGLLASR